MSNLNGLDTRDYIKYMVECIADFANNFEPAPGPTVNDIKMLAHYSTLATFAECQLFCAYVEGDIRNVRGILRILGIDPDGGV